MFAIPLPDPVTGACPADTTPVYRVYNNRPDVNHRYMTSRFDRSAMLTSFWIAEGYGPESVAMCAPNS